MVLIDKYRSSGKLMITGEYLVLDGALSFALPTIFGQSMEVYKNEDNNIRWEAYKHNGELWFNAVFDNDLNPLSEMTKEVIQLKNVLDDVLKIKPQFLEFHLSDTLIKTHLEFPNEWGLGSSSTFLHNIGAWARVSPFVLMDNNFGGSGYDLGVARVDNPTLYKIEKGFPVFNGTLFYPQFKDKLFFVYLNKKVISADAIKKYSEINKNKASYIEKITRITAELVECRELESFSAYLDEHENIMSEFLDTPTIKEIFFKDFNGTIKSLGAWDGDFIMAIGERNYVQKYFKTKGYNTIFEYENIIKIS